jgi:hypothetical protein
MKFMQIGTCKNYVITKNIFLNTISMNNYTNMPCYDVGSADFNVLLLVFVKEQTTRHRSCVAPEEI